MRSQRAFSSWPQSFTASIQYSFHIPLKAEGWVGRDGWLSDLDSCPWEDGHRSSVCTNQARWRATSLTSRKTLQLCHAATSVFDKRPLNECLSVYESVPIQLARRRFPGPAISNAKIYISNKIYESNFIKQHSDTVTVWNYQNADYSLKKINSLCICYYFWRTFVPWKGLPTFSAHRWSELMLRSHQPTPNCLISAHVGAPFCMLGNELSSSSCKQWEWIFFNTWQKLVNFFHIHWGKYKLQFRVFNSDMHRELCSDSDIKHFTFTSQVMKLQFLTAPKMSAKHM